MTSNELRVRFAPSPTGFLHLGGVRTALFNWFFARHHGGKFILRIEDTDVSRSTEESIQVILQGLRWLGLDWDEGPYRQTSRQAIYLDYIEKLLQFGHAYHCYCSPEELDKRRKEALAHKEKPKYDGKCRRLQDSPAGKPSVVRFKSPTEGHTVVNDLLRGEISFNNAELDDFIILRSDSTPTYNFCVVVDDTDMRISHVIRGDDHLTNTPRQVTLYNALGVTPPAFAHLSMILGQDRARLSKRHGATSVLEYQQMGYLPEAVVNYMVRLGWSHGDKEIFSSDEIIEHFTLENINLSAAVFNPDKLLWLNSHYIKNYNPSKLAELLIPFLLKAGISQEEIEINRAKLPEVVKSLQERSKTMMEMADSARFFLSERLNYQAEAAGKFLKPKAITYFQKLLDYLREIDGLSPEGIESVFQKICTEEGVKLGEVAQPVRVALTGSHSSPGIFEVIAIMGKDKTIRRLQQGIDYISQKHNPE